MKLYTLLFFFVFFTTQAHTNVEFRKKYGNVNLISSTSYFTEEVNKNIILAKYLELLSTEIHFVKQIHLRMIQSGDFKCYAHIEKKDAKLKGLNIIIFNRETDIRKTLNLVYAILTDKNSTNTNQNNFSIWYNSDSSEIINKLLSNKINRPKDVEQLESRTSFDYYYENEVYHILSFQNREVIEVAQLTNVLQFSIPEYDHLFIFTELNSLTVIKSHYKYNFEEKKYYPTFELNEFKTEPVWIYSFRPYGIRLLGKKYISVVEYFGEKVSLYDIAKKELIQDLDVLINK